ncbi:MAG: LLM class flavin-dependent oxidoreductase [Chloroflexi bacterium]|nr:LLM class flavin-dependent oxidoreductase [Chloroflexota bacterium]
MTNKPKIQFGWGLPPGARATEDSASFDSGMRRTLTAISGHFDSAWMTDHLQWGEDECLEAMTTLAFYAALTPPELKWGTMVTCQSYRTPGYIAKMASTIQYLSGGRLILGLGAGWKEDEYHAYGFDFPPPGVRLDQLEETARIVREMWVHPHDATFNGKYYRVQHARNLPNTPQPPQLLIGGGGEKKTLPIAARYADWWNVTAYASDYARKVEVLKRECDKIGRDFATLRLSWYGGIGIGKTQADIERRTRDDFTRKSGFTGAPDQIAATIQSLIDVGCSYFMIDSRGIPEDEELELLIELTHRWD